MLELQNSMLFVFLLLGRWSQLCPNSPIKKLQLLGIIPKTSRNMEESGKTNDLGT